MVYLLHFNTPYEHAKHYTGSCEDGRLEARVEEHRTGQGARLMEVVTKDGIGFEVARTWKGVRRRERQLKKQGGASRHCPLCRAQANRP